MESSPDRDVASAEMSLQVCFICDGILDDGSKVTVVKEKGLKTFSEASKQRKDGKGVHLVGKTSIEVHEKCRKQYINEKLIAAYTKRAHQGGRVLELRSSVPTFSFKTHCFLCGLVITPEFIDEQKRLPASKRNLVYTVRQLTVRNNVVQLAEKRNDEYGRAILQRVGPVPDLIAADGQYHLFCMKKLYCRPQAEEKKVRGPFGEEIEEAMQNIFHFLDDNDEECQFSLEELMNKIEGDYRPDIKTVKDRLLKKYGSDILISTSANKKPVVCFKNTGYQILTDSWYQHKSLSEKEERRRIVETAAAIIVEDIRSQVHDTTQYPPPDCFLEENENLIPDTLRAFTETVVLSKKHGDIDKWKKKSVALAHTIISAVRPKSFLSPMQVGLAAFLYKKYGSRKLIDVLSSLGFCSSYTEAVRLEVSAILSQPLEVNGQSFAQLVYDNADFNVQTLDGYNTFHMMGGIVCITPKSAVAPDQKIARIQNDIPSAEAVGRFGAVQLRNFERTNNTGLSTIKIQNLNEIYPSKGTLIPSVSDLLWLYGKFKDLPGILGWNGFMEEVTKDLSYHTTCVACQPFINAPPSNYDTIYTALLCAAEKTKLLHQVTCLVTFDQPLYLKARDIISSRYGDPELSNVVIRLGGFHLLMSFMGSIGYIMRGSGLTELFNTVYAMNSIEKIMTGHAYSRAVRAHILAHRTLAKIVFESTAFGPILEGEIEGILYSEDKTVVLSANPDDCLKDLKAKFASQLQQLEKNGPTAKLWIQYFEMVTLVKHFIEAERSGNWNLHLETINNMLPYFHASGHFLYAKCSHLYLQDMHNLKNTMPADEYECFTSKGGFTVRRSNKLWCGTWSDMIIEQSLMKTMKTAGGLTHGRGVSEGVISRWTQGMTSLQHICDEIEDFCGVQFTSSEQHVDSRDSRIQRDNDDAKKMLEWFHQYPPFPETPEITSISSGIVGDDRINCHMSREMGMQSLNRILGGDFQSVKFKQNDRVKPLAFVNCAIQLQNKTIAINPCTLFQRMCIAKQSNEELQEYLTYELCPYPLSLFDESGMRKGTKSSLYKLFNPAEEEILGSCIFVIDGGYLLHRVVWHSGQSFLNICGSYVSFVQNNYKSNAVIVFDGYPDNIDGKSTKYAERSRRAQKKNSMEVLFNETMAPIVSQDKFLANSKNKSRLISMLMKKFTEAKMVCKQAKEDADTLIIGTAITLAQTHESVVVVGQDVDLPVIMAGLCTSPNVHFLKPGKGKVPQVMYHPQSALDKTVAQHILFLHAMSGCDTTSALFNQGKIKCVNTLQKNPGLIDIIQGFKNPEASQEEIVYAGEQFLIALYGSGRKKDTSLNKVRYRHYITSAYKTTANIASLPPTEAAARQHSLRVFFQVQKWLGHEKIPEEWGWKPSKNGLMPVTTLQPPAPEAILNYISCKCKTGCRGSCGCRKAGLYCSQICLNCEGTCENLEKEYCVDADEDVDEPDNQGIQDHSLELETEYSEGIFANY